MSRALTRCELAAALWLDEWGTPACSAALRDYELGHVYGLASWWVTDVVSLAERRPKIYAMRDSLLASASLLSKLQ